MIVKGSCLRTGQLEGSNCLHAHHAWSLLGIRQLGGGVIFILQPREDVGMADPRSLVHHFLRPAA